MKVKIIGGYHRGQVLHLQDHIGVVCLPKTFEADFSLDATTPRIEPATVCRYKLYKQYRYVDAEFIGYFVPEEWAHHEVERILMDAIV